MRTHRETLWRGLLVGGLALVLGGSAVADDAKVKAKVGKAAPEFTLKDCDGKEHSLSDFEDKIVVLEWVNQQCPWCIKAIPTMKKLHKKYGDNEDIVWIGIESTNWRKPAENKKFIKEHKLAYPILMDNSGRVGKTYGAKTTPHVYVIAKGKLVYQGALHNNQYGKKKESEVRNYLDEALTAILADKDVPVAETTPWGCSVKYKKK